ncbi:electron transfer flavoprotein subunit alpha/FixB family protein [uncultured Dysosmobacter sp.]|uniref:electron transfer flavoprotein subunit alpha/FixB family protein n=1 Tax=uncultured Dysosmobacter sp. TaxID=2591384 RepID=UPI00260F4EEF|nr:electron transfer flavoprotein subunit alpha/FixB family protein [uncultured Dysosmobacter sp.]
MKKDVCVCVQLVNHAPSNVSLEALALAAKLTDGEGKVSALVLGAEEADLASTLIAYGADRVVLVKGGRLAEFSADAYVQALHAVLGELSPQIVLLGSTGEGKELAARAAEMSCADYVSDVIDVAVEGENLYWKRFAYSGSVIQKETAQTACVFATVRPNAFKKCEPDAARTGETLVKEYQAEDQALKTQVLEMITTMSEDAKIEEADIVVCAGRGMGSEEDCKALQELADLLGGVVGGTRPAVEAGWVARNNLIGQSGKSVAPRIYIAFGVSGAVQHLAGISGADYIVAVNRDEDAAIFNVANVGIVADAKQALTVMIDEIKRMQSK